MKRTLALVLAVLMIASMAIVGSAKSVAVNYGSYDFRDGEVDVVANDGVTKLGTTLVPGVNYTWTLIEGELADSGMTIADMEKLGLVTVKLEELDDKDDMVDVSWDIFLDELQFTVKVADKHLNHPSNFSFGIKATFNMSKIKKVMKANAEAEAGSNWDEEAFEAEWAAIVAETGSKPSVSLIAKYWAVDPGEEIFADKGDRKEVTIDLANDAEYEVELDASEKPKNIRFTDAPSNPLIETYFVTPMSFYTCNEYPRFNNVGTLFIDTDADEGVEYFLYAMDKEGYLSEVANAKYDNGTFEIRTRTIGSYVVAEEELDIESYNEFLKSTKTEVSDPAGNPNTGR